MYRWIVCRLSWRLETGSDAERTVLLLLLQQQLLGYQSQLNKRRQMLETVDSEHRREVEQLEAQVRRVPADTAGAETRFSAVR